MKAPGSLVKVLHSRPNDSRFNSWTKQYIVALCKRLHIKLLHTTQLKMRVTYDETAFKMEEMLVFLPSQQTSIIQQLE